MSNNHVSLSENSQFRQYNHILKFSPKNTCHKSLLTPLVEILHGSPQYVVSLTAINKPNNGEQVYLVVLLDTWFQKPDTSFSRLSGTSKLGIQVYKSGTCSLLSTEATTYGELITPGATATEVAAKGTVAVVSTQHWQDASSNCDIRCSVVATMVLQHTLFFKIALACFRLYLLSYCQFFYLFNDLSLKYFIA